MQNISLKNNTEQVDLVYLTHKLEAQFVSKNLINNTENLTVHFSINPTGKIISVKDFGGVIGNMMKTVPIDKNTIPKIKDIMNKHILNLGGNINMVDWTIEEPNNKPPQTKIKKRKP